MNQELVEKTDFTKPLFRQNIPTYKSNLLATNSSYGTLNRSIIKSVGCKRSVVLSEILARPKGERDSFF